MLSALRSAVRTAPRRRPALAMAPFHSAVPTMAEDKSEATAASGKDISPMGIDRSNPLYAPSYRREWKHYGYTNIAKPEEGEKYWTEWKDLPAPYKYLHVKLDPADVEKEGMLWKLATNWKTALPLSLGLAMPLFAYDIIVIDSHVELAAIFWATIAMLHMNFGGAIRKSIMEETEEIEKEVRTAEKEYFDTLAENIDVHNKAADLPKYVRMINEGERALRHVEAAAATRRVKTQEANRMVEMLDYLVMTSGAEQTDTGDALTVHAQTATEDKLAKDKQAQQQSIADALSALKSTGAPQAGNVTEKIFRQAAQEFAANPPKPDPAQQQAALEHEREIFNKRFGFVITEVTEEMLDRAQGDDARMAVLTAQVGGRKPEVGMPLVAPNPYSYRK